MVKGGALERRLPGAIHYASVFRMGARQVAVATSRRAFGQAEDAAGLGGQSHRVANDVVHPTAEVANSLRPVQFSLARLQVSHAFGKFAAHRA